MSLFPSLLSLGQGSLQRDFQVRTCNPVTLDECCGLILKFIMVNFSVEIYGCFVSVRGGNES